VKQNLKKELNRLLHTRDTGYFMNIFISSGKDIYKKMPWQTDIDVTVADEAAAKSLIESLAKLQNDASENPKVSGFNYIYPRDEDYTPPDFK